MNDGESNAGETRNDPEYGRRESGDSRAASASRRQRSNCDPATEKSRDDEAFRFPTEAEVNANYDEATGDLPLG